MTSASSMHEAEHPELVLCDNLEGQGAGGDGGRGQDGGNTCIPMANSCCRMAKAITML